MLPLADARHLYRVRPGFTFGSFDEKHPGDLVELTVYEAQGFLDKLELVVEEAPRPVVDLVSAQATVRPTKAAVKRGKRG